MNTTAMVTATADDHRPVSRVLLWRLAQRRDRVLVPVWLAVLVITSYVQVTATLDLYASELDRRIAANAINTSSGIVALYGPILDVTSMGEFAMTKMTVMYAVLVSVMMLFVVRRHTRLDEEAGRMELLVAAAMGGSAPLRATVMYGSAVSLLLGALVAAANTLGGLPLVGSLAFGGVWAGTGLVAVGVTALACQLSASSRTCAAIASTTFGVLYVLRAVGDTTRASWLSWLSPYGWNTRLRAYSSPRWQVLLLYVALSGVLVLTAAALRRHRDLGSGVVQPRSGSPTGSPRLRNVMALEARLHAPMLTGWTAAVAVTGVVMGSITSSMRSFGTPEVDEMLARLGGQGTLADMMFTSIVVIFALVVTAFGITVVGHFASDEQAGRADQVLAATTSRARMFATMSLIAFGGATWLLLVTGVALTIGIRGHSDHSSAMLIVSSLAPAPAVWVVVAIGVLCYVIRSRWVAAGWGFLLLFATLGQIGEFIDLPQWVMNLSPYSHITKMPQESFRPVPALMLTGLACLLLTVSWLRYRTRDIG